jgi:hypothetical protein
MANTVQVNQNAAMGIIGSVLAVVMSSALNHSFWWGLLHFCLGWIYVIWALLVHSAALLPALKLMFGIACIL